MRRNGTRLVPVDQFSADDLVRVPQDRDVLVRVSSPRNMKLMRFMWALADKVADACEGLHDKDDAMDMLKIKARHVKYITDPRTGAVQIVPKSLAKTDGAALSRLANRMVYIVCSDIIPTLDEGTLRAEILSMVAGDDRSPDIGASQVHASAPPHSSEKFSPPSPSQTMPAPEDGSPVDPGAGATTSPEGLNSPGTGEAKQIGEPGNHALDGSAGLPPGFLKVYAKRLGAATNKPKSLLNCHEKILPTLGDYATPADLQELHDIYALFQRHLKGEMSGEDLAAQLRELGAA